MKKLSILLADIVLTIPSVAQAGQALVDLIKKVKPCIVLIQTFDKSNGLLGQGSSFFVNNKVHILKGAYRTTVKTLFSTEYQDGR